MNIGMSNECGTPAIQLNNGIKMPQVGLGTFLIPKENLSKTIAQAYEMGYRQFDTAWRYHNEEDIAKALKENGINRQDVFITTKVNVDALYLQNYRYGYHSIFNIRNYKSIKQVIQESFTNLDTDYIDLFLVHWPFPMYLDMYKELTKLYHQGRIRAIGGIASPGGIFPSSNSIPFGVRAISQPT